MMKFPPHRSRGWPWRHGGAQANREAMKKAGCMACHSKDKKLVGPSFKDIAAKYKGQDVRPS
jgi:cytochrome c551/c552